MAQRNKVGHYDIVAELGRGGMGVVYKGYEASLNRHVAIKMLSEALADDASVVERFFREARSMAQLNDPHIVQIYLVGEDQGQPFFAMEFVEGESLSGRLKRERRLEPFEAARILLQVAQGLAGAHDRGVIHRDIKPANLLITQRGVVKVADFGIALATQDFNKKLTGTGQFVGTPGYLSPEVCLGKPVDQRSDIFALGIVFFEMLTGQTPYKDESPLGMMLEVVQAEIPDVRQINESVDPQLSAILKRMVAKEPGDRYADCHQLIADLVAVGVNAATPVAISRPVSNPALGTVVNAPTPVEMKRLTPGPVAAPAPAYRTEPAAPVPAPVAVASPPRPPVASVPARKSSVLPWAAAVVALVGGGGAAAWYYGGLKDKFTEHTVVAATPADAVGTTAASTAPVSTPPVSAAPVSAPPVSPPVAPTVAMSPASSADPAQPAAVPPAPAASVPSADVPATVAVAAPPASELPTAAPPANSETVAAVESLPSASLPPSTEQMPAEQPMASVHISGGDRGAAPVTAPQSPQSAMIGSRIAELRERHLENREARADRRGTQVAKASVAPPVSTSAPAYNGPPRVIVLGIGDPAVASAAEMAVEERLDETGVVLVDEDLVRGLSDAESGAGDMRRLLGAVARNAEYVVVVRAVPNGQQQLEFYGESMPQYNALLQVAVYDVNGARKVGSGWQTSLSFTHLNAADNTREALAPYLSKIVQGVGGGRGRG